MTASSSIPSGTAEASVYDLIVIGAGGGGMAAALFGAIAGARVLLIESTSFVGGTTAFSGGTTWIPNTRHAASVNPDDSVGNARKYLSTLIGPHLNPDLLEAFLKSGPQAIDQLEDNSDVHFRAFPLHPDYESEIEGSTTSGRALEPLPFDGGLLGDAFRLVRPPIPEFTVLGGMMVDRTDIGHLLNVTKKWKSFGYSLKLIARHLRDRLTHPRGTRLLIGNALVGRFLFSLNKRKVPIWTEAAVTAMQLMGSGVMQLSVTRGGQQHVLRATHGVVMAAGGFSRNEALRQERLGKIAPFSSVAPGNTGGGIELALSLGGRMGKDGYEPVQWAPVSARQRPDGTMAVFPHFIMDRGKPGTMVVNQRGERFLNETLSYHRFGHAMREANTDGACIPAYLVVDRQAMQKYGLGMVRPGTRDASAFIAEGYLFEAKTLEELAGKLGMQPAALAASAAQINRAADTGVDEAFGRGSTIYQRNIGDPAAANPNLGRIDNAPFYAVRIYPGDIGAASGLVTDTHANVLGAGDQPIPGLYAVGGDMHSVMGGTYPGPGITIGPAIAFAFRAVEHAMARATP